VPGDAPAITQHTQLSAICHPWRNVFARPRALVRVLPAMDRAVKVEPFTLIRRDGAFIAVLSHCMALESLSVPPRALTDTVLDALRVFLCQPYARVESRR